MDRSFWLRALGQLAARQCVAPRCVCAQALLFVWTAGRTVHYELRTRTGKQIPGDAFSEREAVFLGSAVLYREGLERMRVVHGRPTEVPRA